MRYEDPVKGNKILINKSVCNKKKKIRSRSLYVILIIFFHSIGEVFNFIHKVYFFPTYYFKY